MFATKARKIGWGGEQIAEIAKIEKPKQLTTKDTKKHKGEDPGGAKPGDPLIRLVGGLGMTRGKCFGILVEVQGEGQGLIAEIAKIG
ncbi:MAG TPA: hypothetical protein VKV30_16580 [Candidatus Angelobacter sp.]|nr:hypothetical protein [Candidatus Angelobacter sp.]